MKADAWQHCMRHGYMLVLGENMKAQLIKKTVLVMGQPTEKKKNN